MLVLDPTFTDPLDKYQFMVFRWLLFLIFFATVLKVLDEHLHLIHLRELIDYLANRFKR
jgi:hypothetical protein